MNIIKFFFFITLIFTQCSFAMHYVQVQNQSATGKTIRLAIGSLYGLVPTDQGQISLKEGGLVTPKYKYLVSGSVLKVFQNFSYWYFPSFEGQRLKLGKSYALQIERETMHGRKDITLKYKVRSYENPQVKKDFEAGPNAQMPSSSLQVNDVYKNKVYKEKKVLEADLEIEKEVRTISTGGILLKEDFQELQFIKSDITRQKQGKLIKSHKSRVAKKQNLAQLEKISSKKYGYDEVFYGSQGYYSGNDDFIAHDSSVIKEYRERKIARQRIPEATKEMLKSEGALWSADMNSKELQDYLLQTGIAKERRRQQDMISLKSGNEFIFYFSSNLSQNFSSQDSNHQNNGLAMGIGYDLHLVRATKALEKWTVDFMYERGNLNVDLGGINGRFIFDAVSTHINYYLYNFPHSHNKFAIFTGIGVKRGTGDTTSISLSKTYEYQFSAIPTMHIGMKYRIPAAREYEFGSSFGFGINARIIQESLSLSAVSSVEDDFTPNKRFNNIRADFGLSVFF